MTDDPRANSASPAAKMPVDAADRVEAEAAARLHRLAAAALGAYRARCPARVFDHPMANVAFTAAAAGLARAIAIAGADAGMQAEVERAVAAIAWAGSDGAGARPQ